MSIGVADLEADQTHVRNIFSHYDVAHRRADHFILSSYQR
jgi:hypothetical protein